ncbi:MAG: aminoglycoside phosphotransferase family protein, partial [Anaerobacillus sp.]
DVTKIDGRQAIIMEHIKGRTLGDILMDNRDQGEKYMEISVELQRRIHQVVAHSLEPMSDKLTRQIEAAHRLDANQQSVLINRLQGMVFEKKLCHGDFHLFNLILTDHGVTMIDWVDASSGDIRADVYRTYLLYSQFSEELAEMYLRLYCEKSSLLKEEIVQWAPLIAGARLSEAVSSENEERLIDIVNRSMPS